MKLKDKIVDTAYELFSTKGYDHTSIENILSAVGCSKGGFYHHFKSKEEIMMVVVDNSISDLQQAINTPLDKTFMELFNALFTAICQYKIHRFKEEPTINKVFDYGQNDKVLLSLSRKTHDIIKTRYTEVLQYGLEHNAIQVHNPILIADMATRQTLWLFEALNKAISSEEEATYVNDLISLMERSYARELGVSEKDIALKDSAMTYLNQLKDLF